MTNFIQFEVVSIQTPGAGHVFPYNYYYWEIQNGVILVYFKQEEMLCSAFPIDKYKVLSR